jgi:hypothetical protein
MRQSRREFEIQIERNGTQFPVLVEAMFTPGAPESINDIDGGSPAEADEFEVLSVTDSDGNDVELNQAEIIYAKDRFLEIAETE